MVQGQSQKNVGSKVPGAQLDGPDQVSSGLYELVGPEQDRAEPCIGPDQVGSDPQSLLILCPGGLELIPAFHDAADPDMGEVQRWVLFYGPPVRTERLVGVLFPLPEDVADLDLHIGPCRVQFCRPAAC